MTQEEFHKRYQYNPNTDCLGEGGFGKVYKAYDTHLDHYVAIKMAEVKPHLEEVRLRKEVEVISKLPTHPNIAHYDVCYTFSTFAGEYDFGVLQYYEQGNLQQLLTDKQLTYEQKDNLLKQILEGIVFLHSHGIIHRDLKPQNILISLNRKGEYIPKITDFGISKKLDVNKSSVFTNSLAGVGTLAYASPEQLCGLTIKKNTDLWSFGVIVCYVFQGKLPFNLGNVSITSEAGRIELYKQITNGKLDSSVNELPTQWYKVVNKCLVVDVEKRIISTLECVELLAEKVSAFIKTTLDIEEKTQVKQVDESQTSEVKKDTTNYGNNEIEFNTGGIDEKNKFKKYIFIALGIFASLVIFDVIVALSSNTLKPNRETITDIDGNIYHTVTIGNQTWMIENLKTTKYNNGDPINHLEDRNQWSQITTGAYCDDSNYDFKLLYNWYTVVDQRKIAPIGWHVASDADYANLKQNMKINGFDHDMSISENKFTGAIGSFNNIIISIFTNQIGNDNSNSNAFNFTRGSGCRSGRYIFKGEPVQYGAADTECFNGWWSSSDECKCYWWIKSPVNGYFYMTNMTLKGRNLKTDGHSVRCVKDN